MGLPAYLDAHCEAQENCMLPQVSIGGYQGISQGASSFDRAKNLQGTVNLTKVTSNHTLRGGVDVRQAQRFRSAGGNPSGQLTFNNEFTRQSSDTALLTPSNLGLSMAAFMLGIPQQSQVTIQRPFSYRNHYLGAYAQDSWRATENLTVNMGLRIEWENGPKEDTNAMVTDFDPDAKLAISDLAEAAYARAPLAQLPASQFRVRGGPIYATAAGQDGRAWRPQTLFMPRVSAAYKLGQKTVAKFGYGMFYDTLNAADYTANNLGYNSTTTVTNSTDFGQTFALGDPRNGVLGISDPFPVRNGERFDLPFEDALGVNAGAGQLASLRRTRTTSTRGCSGGAWAFSASWPPTCRSNSRTTGRTRIAAKSPSGRIICRSSSGLRAAAEQRGADCARRRTWRTRTASQILKRCGRRIPSCISGWRRMAFFTSPTVQANRLLRPFSQYNTGDGLVYDNLPLGENKGRSIQIAVNRRYANGFTANLALAFTRTRSNRTVNEFDREPTLWLDDNSSRPYRLSGGAVYELPFGANRRWLSDGGVLAALAGGWQLAGTFERQPGSLIQFTTNTTVRRAATSSLREISIASRRTSLKSRST